MPAKRSRKIAVSVAPIRSGRVVLQQSTHNLRMRDIVHEIPHQRLQYARIHIPSELLPLLWSINSLYEESAARDTPSARETHTLGKEETPHIESCWTRESKDCSVSIVGILGSRMIVRVNLLMMITKSKGSGSFSPNGKRRIGLGTSRRIDAVSAGGVVKLRRRGN